MPITGRPSAVYAAERNAENCISGLETSGARPPRDGHGPGRHPFMCRVTLSRDGRVRSGYGAHGLWVGGCPGLGDEVRADSRDPEYINAPTSRRAEYKFLGHRRRSAQVAAVRRPVPTATLPVRVTGNSKVSPMEFCRSAISAATGIVRKRQSSSFRAANNGFNGSKLPPSIRETSNVNTVGPTCLTVLIEIRLVDNAYLIGDFYRISAGRIRDDDLKSSDRKRPSKC